MASQQTSPSAENFTTSPLVSLLDLPVDTLLHVYKYLSPHSQYNFRLTCQFAADVARQHTIVALRSELSLVYARLDTLQQTLTSRYPKLQCLDLDIHIKPLVHHLNHQQPEGRAAICYPATKFFAVPRLPQQINKPPTLQQMIDVLGSSNNLSSLQLRLNTSPLPVHLILSHFTSLQRLHLGCNNRFDFDLSSLTELQSLSSLAIKAGHVSMYSVQTIPFHAMSIIHLELSKLYKSMQQHPAMLTDVSSVETLKISCPSFDESDLAGFVQCFPNLKHYRQEDLGLYSSRCAAAILTHLPQNIAVLELPHSRFSLNSSSQVSVLHLTNLKRLAVEEICGSEPEANLTCNVESLKLRKSWMLESGSDCQACARYLQAFSTLHELHISLHINGSSINDDQGSLHVLFAALARVPRLYIHNLASLFHASAVAYPLLQLPNVCGLPLIDFGWIPSAQPILPHVQHLMLPNGDAVGMTASTVDHVIELCKHLPNLQSIDMPGTIYMKPDFAKHIVELAQALGARNLRIVLSSQVLPDVIHKLNMQIDAVPGTGCVVCSGPTVWE